MNVGPHSPLANKLKDTEGRSGVKHQPHRLVFKPLHLWPCTSCQKSLSQFPHLSNERMILTPVVVEGIKCENVGTSV